MNYLLVNLLDLLRPIPQSIGSFAAGIGSILRLAVMGENRISMVDPMAYQKALRSVWQRFGGALGITEDLLDVGGENSLFIDLPMTEEH